MKNTRALLLTLVLSFAGILMPAVNAEANVALDAKYVHPASGNVMIEVQGTYTTMTAELQKKILTRLNAIRSEAVKLGYASKYVPINWSVEMEQISKIRTMQASLYAQHKQPNGRSIWEITSSGGQTSWGENLAWASYGDIMTLIELYYDEIECMPKGSRVGASDCQTGHYKAIVNPGYTYVGTSMVTTDWGYGNTNSMEFSNEYGRPTVAGGYGTRTLDVEVTAASFNSGTATIQVPGTVDAGTVVTPAVQATYVPPSDTVIELSHPFKITQGIDWSIATSASGIAKIINAYTGAVSANASGKITFYGQLGSRTLSGSTQVRASQLSAETLLSNPPGIDSTGFQVREVNYSWQRATIGSGWASSQYTHVFNAGDLDGNGFEDMMLTDTSGNLWFYPMVSDTAFKPRVKAGYGWRNMRLIFGGIDFNGDAKVDILGVDLMGRLYLYPGLGNGFFGAKRYLGSGWSSVMNVSMAQVGFNGHPLIMGSVNGILKAWQTDGRAHFTSTITYGSGWDSVKLTAVTGDLSGDQVADMWVVTKDGELRLYVARSESGTRFAAYRLGSGWQSLKYFLPRTEETRVVRTIFPDGALRQYTLTSLEPKR